QFWQPRGGRVPVVGRVNHGRLGGFNNVVWGREIWFAGTKTNDRFTGCPELFCFGGNRQRCRYRNRLQTGRNTTYRFNHGGLSLSVRGSRERKNCAVMVEPIVLQ